MKFKITHTYSVTTELDVEELQSLSDLEIKLDNAQDVNRHRTLAAICAISEVVQAHCSGETKYEVDPFSSND